MHRGFLRAQAISLALLALAGCTVSPPETSTTAQGHSVAPVPVIMDASTGTLSSPLDKYSHSDAERARIIAARVLLFSECALPNQPMPASSIAAAKVALSHTSSYATTFRFGYWDERLTTEHFGLPSIASDIDLSITVDNQTGMQCMKTPALAELEPITVFDFVGGNTLGLQLTHDSYEKALADPRYQAASEKAKSCVQSQGFETSQGHSIAYHVLPSEEAKRKAALVEAACNDRSGVVKTGAELQAGYANQMIAQHEAELVTQRAEAEKRLIKADAVLKKYGLI